ncbi:MULTISPECIES: hypothetical protein [unclassified Polaromonas]|jgi:hypothetical protein|uniref:hypothetical protein n=1 Tax=unclassified Polaromonas TaxID=2638319 RepID=UPI000BD8FEAE|nr:MULTISPECIES: hypothetical protein [unclassified Polaromonas]OYY32343.1 MAG: hypothetical protein B7Y60_22810 [Polaromonas sp. 35-63-35]OYZ15144.1 MAG: hypothetical protein B7Y28_22295 [Polaromonas sp. 16-63-31]OYZ75631.1 MAG: hypothetical protein B7Y09_23435 [Polaromonas sp. 24-63-21]OZA46107.1 MAG: hypothetical protein B7X88_23710 [Polaromonas sp. 17-63-33]OZA85057.1 MAG: hypothetical protein B7X65_23000 [Polaromonas sp. 39-63-25]
MKLPLAVKTVVRRVKPMGMGWSNESMYGAWNRHCLVNGVQGGVQFPLDKSMARRGLFSMLVPDEAEKLAKEMLLTVKEIARLNGADMGKENALVINVALRYCRRCIDLNYHSAVYQHVALARCPLHTTVFHDVCHHCHKPVVPTFASVIEYPFECPNCKLALGRSAARETDASEASAVDTMITDRRRVLAATKPSFHWRFTFSSEQSERLGTPSNPVASRHYQRLCVWQADRSSAHWPRFLEEHLTVTGNSRSTGGIWSPYAQVEAAQRVLLWLRQACYAHELAAVTLAYRLGRYPRGLRIDVHTSLISAAIYKLASAYGLVQDMVMFFESDATDLKGPAKAQLGRTVARYGATAAGEPELDFRLMQLEMLGMFAKLLLMHRHQAPTTEVSWLELPHELEFAPAWFKIIVPSQPFQYVIRPRVNEASLRRLIARKWNHELCLEHPILANEAEFWGHNRLDSLWRTNGGGPNMPNTNPEFLLSNPKLRDNRSLAKVFGTGQQLGRNYEAPGFGTVITPAARLPIERGSRII